MHRSGWPEPPRRRLPALGVVRTEYVPRSRHPRRLTSPDQALVLRGSEASTGASRREGCQRQPQTRRRWPRSPSCSVSVHVLIRPEPYLVAVCESPRGWSSASLILITVSVRWCSPRSAREIIEMGRCSSARRRRIWRVSAKVARLRTRSARPSAATARRRPAPRRSPPALGRGMGPGTLRWIDAPSPTHASPIGVMRSPSAMPTLPCGVNSSMTAARRRPGGESAGVVWRCSTAQPRWGRPDPRRLRRASALGGSITAILRSSVLMPAPDGSCTSRRSGPRGGRMS